MLALSIRLQSRLRGIALRAAAKRSWIEAMETLRQSLDHLGAQDVRDIAHDGIRAPLVDEGLELILDVFRLLAGETGHREGTAKTLPDTPWQVLQ